MRKELAVILIILAFGVGVVIGRISFQPNSGAKTVPVKTKIEKKTARVVKPKPRPARHVARRIQHKPVARRPASSRYRADPAAMKKTFGVKVATDPSPTEGTTRPLVLVIEMSDFQCPVCKRAYPPMKQLKKDFPTQVELVFKQLPLPMHRYALPGAVASMAAARQGKFWQYADILFTKWGRFEEPMLEGIARQVGLNLARFRKDVADPLLKARAQTESAAGLAIGARGTPSFLINGKLQVGWASYQSIKYDVNREIKAVKALMAQGKTRHQALIERIRANNPDADLLLKSILMKYFKW